jgi:protease-4
MVDVRLADQVVTQINKLRQRRTSPLILELDLTEGLTEGPAADPVSALLSRRRIRLHELLDGLRRAREDDRVRVLVVKVGGRRIGLAGVQELRDAIGAFRGSGKLTVAWAETFGEFSRGNVPYYLATAFDRIFLQPSGDLGLTGVAVEQLFFAGALEKIGVDFQSAARREYKTATDALTERGFTPPAREAAERLAASIAEQLTEAISARRGKSPEEARDLLNRGPFLATEALELGLVDSLGYRDEVYAAVRKEAGAEASVQHVTRYQRAHAVAQRARQLPYPREQYVALIHATGPIRRGRSGRGPLSGSAIGSDTVAAALRAARSDDRARAVLLRVNSPGGSYTASDTIWREVVRIRDSGKPVVVSMGDVAASGGYFIAMAADEIVAQPGTLTGSIGVIVGKPVFREMFGRAGVTSDSVSEGAHATMFAPTHPFTDEEWERINAWLDHIYADFTGKVALGRGLAAERVEELARGRVWTGADARANGLVDSLGGLEEAAAIARRRASLPPDAPLHAFPRANPLEQLRPSEAGEARPGASGLALGMASGLASGVASGLVSGVVSGLAPGLASGLLTEGWGPAWRLAAEAGLPPYGPLMLPGSWKID